MSKISVVAIDQHAARLFNRHDGGIAVSDEIFSTMADDAFADRIAAWLEKKTAPAHIDRLVLLGTPPMLNALRRTIKGSVCAQVIAEIHQDLATMSSEELRGELEKILWF